MWVGVTALGLVGGTSAGHRRPGGQATASKGGVFNPINTTKNQEKSY